MLRRIKFQVLGIAVMRQGERRRLSELTKPILEKRQGDEQMGKMRTEVSIGGFSPSVKLARSKGEGKKNPSHFEVRRRTAARAPQ